MTQKKQPEEIELTLQGEEDVLSEVDIYLAYGMHDEAIAALERAIGDSRDRPEYRVRLVEAYAVAEDGKAVQENARIARAQLDSADHALLERIAAAEARFAGLEQPVAQAGGPAVNARSADSSEPAEDPSQEAKGDGEQIGIPANGKLDAGRVEDLAGTRTEPDLVTPDRDPKSRASTRARWLRLSPWWTAALLLVPAVALVLQALPPPGFLDPARESESSDVGNTGSVAADPPGNNDLRGSEQGTKPTEETAPNRVITTLTVGTVSFDPNSTMFDASFEPLLRDVAETLTDHPRAHAEVIGYAESSETIEYSEILARQRAQAVTNRLIGLGVASHRIRVEVPDSDEAAQAVSRPDKASGVEIRVRSPASRQ